MFSQGKKEFRNIKEENRQGFSFPLHPPPHPFHFPKVFSSPPTRIPRNTLIHTHTDIKRVKTTFFPRSNYKRVLATRRRIFKKKNGCYCISRQIVVWSWHRDYYDEPLSLFTQVNSRQVAELLLSTLSL